MPEWFAGNRAKQASRWLTIIGLSTYFVELMIGIFGGAHVAIYHVFPPGYVQIRTFWRYGGTTEYVKPWVADLHRLVLAIFSGCVIALISLWIAAKIAHNPNSKCAPDRNSR